jgi:hypothetical protein
MVSSSIINKRYNSNEVNYTSENKYTYAMQNCSSNCIRRVGFCTQLADTILKIKFMLCSLKFFD